MCCVGAPTLSLFVFLLLFSSALFFYYRSERNKLALVFALLTITIALWCLLVFLGGLPLPRGLRTFILDITLIPIIFLPLFNNYIIRNYTRPHDLIPVPMGFMIAHTTAIVAFSALSVMGLVSPYYLDGDVVRYRGGLTYILLMLYIYVSTIWGLGRVVYNMVKGSYFVRLHSIYIFTGILLASIIAFTFLIALPSQEPNLSPVASFGMLAFLWFSWVPATKYRLFNVALTDFGQDFRNPRLSSIIVTINRFLLNKMDPIAYKDICDQYEKLKMEEIERIQMSGLYNMIRKTGNPVKYIVNTSEKIIKTLFP
ncbi:hypothetical protein EHQ53_03230 [Leptospira langatensis]|uniref:Histidine kinase N-terminal 7TM region domain-containing protein n=1 Tax=Leptospira langatensis TaxID=2484983 RepID=A0A5F1ZY98_9LEPT|nr:hypothetical protein EHO57_03460 [Leptospira langatensis]TGL43654.1 hypothetical protein EHQ53_03230 [Leptospira langatensis]